MSREITNVRIADSPHSEAGSFQLVGGLPQCVYLLQAHQPEEAALRGFNQARPTAVQHYMYEKRGPLGGRAVQAVEATCI